MLNVIIPLINEAVEKVREGFLEEAVIEVYCHL